MNDADESSQGFLELFSRTHARCLAGATLAVAGLGLAIAMSGNLSQIPWR